MQAETGKAIVQRERLMVLIYFAAAVPVSWFWVIRQNQDSIYATLAGSSAEWLLLLAGPLLFVFAYPNYLFDPLGAPRTRLRYGVVLHGLAAAITTVLFAALGAVFWKNPLRNGESILLPIVPIVAVPIFCVAAIYLLLTKRSTLAVMGSFIFWPYLLFFALVTLTQFFQASNLTAAF